MLHTSRPYKCFLASEASFLGREPTEQATKSQVINFRHSNVYLAFLLQIRKPTPSCRPAVATSTIFSVARGKSYAVRAQPRVFVLLYAVSLLFSPLLKQYLYFASATQPNTQNNNWRYERVGQPGPCKPEKKQLLEK